MQKASLFLFVIVVILGLFVLVGFILSMRKHFPSQPQNIILPGSQNLPSHTPLASSTQPIERTPTTTQTTIQSGPIAPTKWKLYRNGKYGFEIKVPESFVIYKASPGVDELESFIDIDGYVDGFPSDDKFFIMIRMVKNPKGLPADKWYQGLYETQPGAYQYSPLRADPSRGRTIAVNGVSGFQILIAETPKGIPEGVGRWSIFTHGGKTRIVGQILYKKYLEGRDARSKTFRDIHEQILYSLRFID